MNYRNFGSNLTTMKRFLGDDNKTDSIKDANTVIIPVPLEYSTSYGKGTAQGPEAIIDASAYLEFYDEELDFETWKTGIYTTSPLDVQGETTLCLRKIEEIVTHYLDKQIFIVVIGGEHSLTSAVHDAFMRKYSELSVLQLDAHSDLRDEYEGSKYSHACVMRRIFEKNQNIVGVGIRSQSIEEREYIVKNRIPIFYAHQILDREIPLSILDELKDNVLITFDTDFFDPAIMPAVGTPEPGGFYWDETLTFLKKVFENKNVVGMDVVEFSPIDNLSHPQFLLAKFIYKMIGYRIKGQNKNYSRSE